MNNEQKLSPAPQVNAVGKVTQRMTDFFNLLLDKGVIINPTERREFRNDIEDIVRQAVSPAPASSVSAEIEGKMLAILRKPFATIGDDASDMQELVKLQKQLHDFGK